jgi:hypothetical protein
MPAPYLTDASLRQALAEALSKSDPATLAVGPRTLSDANQFAGQEVTGRLLGRGYTQAQVDAWDRTVEFATHIALWWLFTYGGVPYIGNDERVKDFDRRKELSDPNTVIFIDGEMILPGRAGPEDPGGSVSSGRIGGGFQQPTW